MASFARRPIYTEASGLRHREVILSRHSGKLRPDHSTPEWRIGRRNGGPTEKVTQRSEKCENKKEHFCAFEKKTHLLFVLRDFHLICERNKNQPTNKKNFLVIIYKWIVKIFFWCFRGLFKLSGMRLKWNGSISAKSLTIFAATDKSTKSNRLEIFGVFRIPAISTINCKATLLIFFNAQA